VIQPRPSAVLLERDGAGAVGSFEAREARLLAALAAAEERLIGLLQAREHIVQHRAVDRLVRWKVRADGLQFRFLLLAREGDAAALPGGAALR